MIVCGIHLLQSRLQVFGVNFCRMKCVFHMCILGLANAIEQSKSIKNFQDEIEYIRTILANDVISPEELDTFLTGYLVAEEFSKELLAILQAKETRLRLWNVAKSHDTGELEICIVAMYICVYY
eukprot:TRINITY_DN17015_c0_g1_i1.p1 TRINITY_DN17015_c0_g1~~TRINITY_DN17015_c0_g1_i1.p1  ORF type:complete len:124 (+),score=18.97 TRINITY_DN17015_c0_g1_i1:143-514(+)